jgi:hypothetical protein
LEQSRDRHRNQSPFQFSGKRFIICEGANERNKMTNQFDTDSGIVTYATIRKATDEEPFTMSLTDSDEIHAVIESVNEGIDSHLEACFCPERGDRYEGSKRKSGKLVLCGCLEYSVSPESLPTLLRRLCESNFSGKKEVQEAGNRLASDILMVLGINEYGKFVGREALGVA